MNRDVIVTCAVTGSGDTVNKHPAIPVTPKEIANAAIEAGKAGASIAHIQYHQMLNRLFLLHRLQYNQNPKLILLC